MTEQLYEYADSRYVGRIHKTDEVTEEGGAVTNDQIYCDDSDDSWNKIQLQLEFDSIDILHI